MAVFGIKRGKLQAPVRAVIYGSEGIGKSTLASELPDPLFLDLEDGTKELDVARIDRATSWAMLLEELEYIRDNPDLCRTVVIDTADRAQDLLEAALLQEYGCKSIEQIGGGYGKGYTAELERWRKDLQGRLDELHAAGLNVVLLAHAIMRKQETPDAPAYDRWELNLSKKIAPALRAWADLLIFCNYQVFVVQEGDGPAKRGKAIGEAKRMMYATHKPTHDAKNRYGLPDEMVLGYEPLRPIFERRAEKKPEATQLNTDTPSEGIVSGDDLLEPPVTAFRRHLRAAGLQEGEVITYLQKRRKLAENGTLDDLSDDYIQTLDDHLEKLKKEIKKGAK